MDKLPNVRRLLYLIGRAVNSDDDAHALALLRAARYLMDAARSDLIGKAPAPTVS
jgi:hypothetical protein